MARSRVAHGVLSDSAREGTGGQLRNHSPVFGRFHAVSALDSQSPGNGFHPATSSASRPRTYDQGAAPQMEDLESLRRLTAEFAERQEELAVMRDREELEWVDAARRADDGELPSRGPPLHYLLHADHERRLDRHQRLRDERQREQVERERFEGPQTRVASKATEEQIVNRLHGEAEQRRLRQEERKHRKEFVEGLQQNLAQPPRGAPLKFSSGEQEKPAWERLHQIASQKDAHLEIQRKQKDEAELQHLQETSVHRGLGAASPAAVVDAAGARLYSEGQKLLLKKEELAQAAEEEERRQLQQVSVHRNSLPSGGSWVQASERLYNDKKKNDTRLEETRQALERKKQEGKLVASRGEISQSVNRLYEDARRRDDLQRLTRETMEQEEFDRCEAESVHSRTKCQPYSHKDVARISDRLYRTRSSTPPRTQQAPAKSIETKSGRPCIGGKIGSAPRFPSRRRESQDAALHRDASAPPAAVARVQTVLDDCAMNALRILLLGAIATSPEAQQTLLNFIQHQAPTGGEEFEVVELLTKFQSDQDVLDEAARRTQEETVKEEQEKQKAEDETEEQWQRRLRKIERAKLRAILVKREEEAKNPPPADSVELLEEDVRQVVRLVLCVETTEMTNEQIGSLCKTLSVGQKLTFQAFKHFLGFGRITLNHSELEFTQALRIAEQQRPPERPKAPLGRSRSAVGATPRGSSTLYSARQGPNGARTSVSDLKEAAPSASTPPSASKGAGRGSTPARRSTTPSAPATRQTSRQTSWQTPLLPNEGTKTAALAAAVAAGREKVEDGEACRDCANCSPKSTKFDSPERAWKTDEALRALAAEAARKVQASQPKQAPSQDPPVLPPQFKECAECSPKKTEFDEAQEQLVGMLVTRENRPVRSPRRGRSPRMSDMQRHPDVMMQLVQEGALMGFSGGA